VTETAAPPWSFTADLLAQNAASSSSGAEKNCSDSEKNLQSFPWWRCRELNPGPKLCFLPIVHKISQFISLNDRNWRDIIKIDLRLLNSNGANQTVWRQPQ
jgi:hypothetical protein